MDKVVYDRIDDVLNRVESLFGRVEDTYLVAKDILLGTQISDWIADLKASGTSSATYQDASRMNALIANNDAANNSDVAKYLVQWAIANNKFGTYCGGACENVSGVSWDSLTTPNAVMGNAAGFTALCENAIASKEIMNNPTCRSAICENAAVTEPVFRMKQHSFIRDYSQTQTISQPISNVKYYVYQATNNGASTAYKFTKKAGGTQTVNIGSNATAPVEGCFTTGISWTGSSTIHIWYIGF